MNSEPISFCICRWSVGSPFVLLIVCVSCDGDDVERTSEERIHPELFWSLSGMVEPRLVVSDVRCFTAAVVGRSVFVFFEL